MKFHLEMPDALHEWVKKTSIRRGMHMTPFLVDLITKAKEKQETERTDKLDIEIESHAHDNHPRSGASILLQDADKPLPPSEVTGTL